MALLFADGFEDGSGAWTLGSAAIGTGRYGNGMVLSSISGSADMGFVTTAGPIIAGFAFKPAGAGVFAAFMIGTSQHTALNRLTGGEVQAVRGSTANVLGTSASGVLPASAWSYVEVETTISNTTGIVVVKVNGIEILNLTGQDTLQTSADMNAFRLGAASGGSNSNAYDDFYVADTTGSYNNDFLGDLQVEHLRPASDDTAQWLGSDGNSTDNYALVDEAGTYSGSDYVASSTVGQRDLYVPTASSYPTTGPVHGVVVVAVAQKTDAGVRTAKLNVKEGSGGTVRQSAELGLPTSFGELRAVFERKGDGLQFTVADVNALRMGIEVAT